LQIAQPKQVGRGNGTTNSRIASSGESNILRRQAIVTVMMAVAAAAMGVTMHGREKGRGGAERRGEFFLFPARYNLDTSELPAAE